MYFNFNLENREASPRSIFAEKAMKKKEKKKAKSSLIKMQIDRKGKFLHRDSFLDMVLVPNL